MEIAFTKEQYENLIKLVYLGSWMVNSIREDKGVKKFDDLEQYGIERLKLRKLKEKITK